MARKGGNKKRCEKYRLSGHREENKRKKQEKAQKRMEKFAARKESGNTYEERRKKKIQMILSTYNIDMTTYKKYKDEYIKKAIADGIIPAPNKSGKARDTEFSRWRGIERKLNDEVAKKKMEMKKLEKFKNKLVKE